MVLTHVLITRFSYDAGGNRANQSIIRPDWTTTNILAPHRLEKRFTLFETFGVPSVLSQTVRDFVWILIIDRRLNERGRARLRALTRPHRKTWLVDYDPSVDYGGLRWLQPYIDNAATTHVATTNVDDDDLMSAGLVEYIQRHLHDRDQAGDLPPCTIVGCTNPLQWDFMPTRKAPLGYLKSWRRRGYASFAAFTVCCQQPGYDVSVLGFEHTLGAAYFDPNVTIGDRTQARLRVAAERAGDDWRGWTADRHWHVVQSETPPIVVVNHIENDDIIRLFEHWSGRRPVRGREDFPGIALDIDTARASIRAFRRSPAVLCRYLYRAGRLILSRRATRGWNKRQIVSALIKFPRWFFVGLPETREGA